MAYPTTYPTNASNAPKQATEPAPDYPQSTVEGQFSCLRSTAERAQIYAAEAERTANYIAGAEPEQPGASTAIGSSVKPDSIASRLSEIDNNLANALSRIQSALIRVNNATHG
jgi:hypothetical protein